MIKKTCLKIRERVNMIKRFRLNGFTSSDLRKTMFMSFVLPLFVSLFPIYPLFTRRQQEEISDLYYTCLKRLSFHLEWADPLFVCCQRNFVGRSYCQLLGKVPDCSFGLSGRISSLRADKLEYFQKHVEVQQLSHKVSTQIHTICTAFVITRKMHSLVR